MQHDIEIICYLTNDNGNKYAEYKNPIQVKGEFIPAFLDDLLNYHVDGRLNALESIDIPNDGNAYLFYIKAKLLEGTGVYMDSHIGYGVININK
jgi:hypothetical protein